MNKTAIKNFAIWARNKLIADICYRAGLMGITEKGIADALPQSTREAEFYDFGATEPYLVAGEAIKQRRQLVSAIREKEVDTDYATAYQYIMEEVAYTWFNRLIAVRFMEVNDYLPSHLRVLSSESGKVEPDLVTTPFDAELPFTAEEEAQIIQWKQDNKLDELFRFLFIKQCNALNEILPGLFEKTTDYTEVLLNLSVVDQEGVVYKLTHDIPEKDFNIEQVYKKGVLMVDHGEIQDFPSPEIEPYLVERAHKTFHVAALTAEDFAEKRPRGIIGMVDGEITTVDAGYSDRIDVEYDVLKIAVVERHKNTHHIGIGYIQGYGLKSGAVATSISHDSHNIIVVGTNETDMAAAVNRVVELNGGIVVWDGGQSVAEVPLAIAGIMSDEPLVTVNEKLETAKDAAHKLGVNPGIDPFMTLSFMALPVIPSLRITTRGVFDVTTQSYV